MTNSYDKAAQKHYDRMTKELGRKVKVSTMEYVLDAGGQEGTLTDTNTFKEEIVFLQEIDSAHEMVASGQLSVGDVRLEFQADSIAVEEGVVVDGNRKYTIRNLTKVMGMNNNVILRIRAFGKKISDR